MVRQNVLRSDIPEWFCIENYSPKGEASLVDWGANFAIRRQALAFLNTEEANGMRKYGEEYFAIIKKYGFLPREVSANYFAEEQWMLEERLAIDNGDGHGLVYSLPLEYAVHISEWVQWDTELRHKLELIKYNKIFHHARTEPLTATEIALAAWHSDEYKVTPFHERYESLANYVCVDINAPDDSLVDAFKSWLKSARERAKDGYGMEYVESIPFNFSSATVARWSRHAILPYLDLLIFQTDSKSKIPLHIIGQAILPDSTDIDTTEAVRKSTHPTAMRALELCWIILSQGLREEALRSGTKNR